MLSRCPTNTKDVKCIFNQLGHAKARHGIVQCLRRILCHDLIPTRVPDVIFSASDDVLNATKPNLLSVALPKSLLCDECGDSINCHTGTKLVATGATQYLLDSLVVQWHAVS